MAGNTTNVSNRTIARNTAFLYARMAVSLIVSLYTSRVVLNTLGVMDYGIYNVVAGFVSMFAFLNSALTASIQRYYNFERGRNGNEGVERVYKVAITSQIMLAILVLLLVEGFGIWYFENKLVVPADRFAAAHILFQMSVASMVLLILQIPYSAAVVSFEKMDYYAMVGVLDTFLRLGIVIALPFIPYDKLITYSCLALSVSGLNYLLYYAYVKKKLLHYSFNWHIDFRMLKELILFSGWNAFGAFTIMMRSQGLNMILNLFFGPVVNAARGIAYSVQSALIGFVQNIFSAARPQLTESYAKGDYRRSTSLMYSISKLCFILLYLMALPISGEISYVLHLWLGEAVPEYSTSFTIVVLSITLVDVLNTPVSIMMLATGKIVKFNLVASLVGLLVLPLSYLVLKLGSSPISAFYTSFFISIVVQIICVFIMQSKTGIKAYAYCKNVVMPLVILVISTFFIPFISHSYMSEGFLRLLVTTTISIASVILVSYLLVLNKGEKTLVNKMVLNVYNKIKRK